MAKITDKCHIGFSSKYYDKLQLKAISEDRMCIMIIYLHVQFLNTSLSDNIFNDLGIDINKLIECIDNQKDIALIFDLTTDLDVLSVNNIPIPIENINRVSDYTRHRLFTISNIFSDRQFTYICDSIVKSGAKRCTITTTSQTIYFQYMGDDGKFYSDVYDTTSDVEASVASYPIEYLTLVTDHDLVLMHIKPHYPLFLYSPLRSCAGNVEIIIHPY